MSRNTIARGRAAASITLTALFLTLATGCQTVRELVAIPFDVAAHAAAEAARIPYEAGKIGAQGVVDAIAGALR